MDTDIRIKTLQKDDISELTAAFRGSEWVVGPAHFEGYLAEQDAGKRITLLAYVGDYFAGYVNVVWESNYPPFAEKDIPEVHDLRVLAPYRRRGIATALMDEAEKRIFEKSPVAGIGVGMYAGYGTAQRMYVLRGYVPDGAGLMYHNRPVVPYREVCVDDALVMYFVKERK